MTFPASPTFPVRFKRPLVSRFPSAPTFPSSSGPPTPPVVFAGAFMYLIADFAAASALWKDQSGSGNDVAQSNSGDYATLATNAINGKSAFSFNGTSSFFISSSISTSSGGFTGFMVLSRPAWSNTSNYLKPFTKGSGDNTTDGLGLLQTGAAQNYWQTGDIVAFGEGYDNAPACNGPNFSAANNQFLLISWVLSSGVAKIFRNGVLASVQSFPATVGSDNNPVYIGNNFGSGQVWDGKIAMGLFYGTNLSDSNRQANQATIGAYYAIPLGQPQISFVDFNGQTGVNYVTGGPGNSFNFFDIFGQTYAPWYNTGTESNPGGTGLLQEVYISTIASAADIALATVNAINSAFGSSFVATQVNGGGTNTACQISTKPNSGVYGATNSAVDGNTGAAISTTQTGSGNL